MTWIWRNRQLDRIEKEVEQANAKLNKILALLTKTPTKLEVKLGTAVKR
jgi:hypothetical protein